MNPCSLRTRTTSFFSFEYGATVDLAPIRFALRILVRRSAIGSVMLTESLASTVSASKRESKSLPACLPNARDLALRGEAPETDPADLELPVIGPAPAAELAAVVAARRELRRPQLLHLPGRLGHRSRYLRNGSPN